jgi:tetratricopeptide (TPR) repeat protein
MTVDEAIALIEQVLERGRLSKAQEIVFRQSWIGKSYWEIAKESDYDAGHIKDTGATLWRSLSQGLGEKVTKHNIQGVLLRFAQQREQKTNHVANQAVPISSTLHNLPARDFHYLIGRDLELRKVLEQLSFNTPNPCISIEGIGGMGKTTLALAAAFYSLQLPPSPLKDSVLLQPIPPEFDAIIFTSAKPERLTPQGILPRLQPQRRLQDLFRAIARTLNRSDILLMDFDEQVEQIQDSLQRQKTLLILDNLETVEDEQLILAFLYDLPMTVKVILSSCQRSTFPAIRLEPLLEPDGRVLIQQQAQIKGITLTSTDIQTLYACTSGVPAAIVYAVGQVAAGYPIQSAAAQLTLPVGEYAHFYFKSSMTRLQGTLAHHLLMALALFPSGATVTAIADVVGTTTLTDAIDGLAQLQQLSLVRQQDGKYSLLELTREYALAELETHSNFAQPTRDRWVQWYHRFAQEHGGKDAKEWQEYDSLDQEWENLQAVIEWCIANERDQDVQQFWRQVNCYTHTQGYRRNRLTAWNTRLDWANWLIQSAKQQQDWATALEVMLEQGWTLTLLGQPRHLEQAQSLYRDAWNQRHHQTSHFQVELAINWAVLLIQQEQFTQASEWLQKAQELLASPEMDSASRQRSHLQIQYYQGEIAYKLKNYSQAQQLFQQVLTQAEQLNWQRAIFLAREWLADIAIQQQQFLQAQHWLEEGLQVAQANQDECRLAFCQRSFARLESARGNRAIAQRWATTAKQQFERLGMLTEVRETEDFLQTLA